MPRRQQTVEYTVGVRVMVTKEMNAKKEDEGMEVIGVMEPAA